eukprot:jgi/Mesen1/2045/ME000149S01037
MMANVVDERGGNVASGGPAQSMHDFPLGEPPMLQPELPFSPFYNNSRPGNPVLENIRLILMLPIFVLRAIFLLINLILGYITTKIALVGARNVLTKPFPAWRRAMLWPVRLCARNILFCCGYHYIKVKGKAAERQVAPVIVSNHVTFVDPVFIFFAHLPMIVTAKENLAIPVAGVVMQALQVVSLDRTSPTSRKDAAGEIKRRAMCNDWAHVALFPEATTTNGRSLVQFKTGAFAPGLSVQPVVVRYPFVHLDPSWVVDGPPIHLLLFKLMTQLYNNMEYLPVVEPTLKEARNPHLFAERTRTLMAQALNVNVTEHTFGDVALALECEKLRVPRAMTNVEFGRLERLFRGLDIREAKGFLRKWATLIDARTHSNRVDAGMFQALLAHLPREEEVTRLPFHLLDTADRGFINFRQFLAGMAFVVQHPRLPAALAATFDFFDADGDGVMKFEETRAGLEKLFPSISVQQVQALYKAMDLNADGVVSRDELREYLETNPEYVMAILFANPSLAGEEQDSTFFSSDRSTSVNGGS